VAGDVRHPADLAALHVYHRGVHPVRRELVFVALAATGLARAAPSRAQEPTARVHVDAPEPVTLEVESGTTWTRVCASPCDTSLPTTSLYRIGGGGIRTSRPFVLGSSAPAGSEVNLRVSPAGWASVPFGIVIVSLGGTATLLGGLALAVGTMSNVTAGSSGDGSIIGGSIALGAGVVLVTVGIVMIVCGQTKVVKIPPTLLSSPVAVPWWPRSSELKLPSMTDVPIVAVRF
jgi:hypothetical protein